MKDDFRILKRALREARRMGRNGRPCPFVSGVSVDMEREDRELLVYAFVRRNFPNYVYSKNDINSILTLVDTLVENWLRGARECQ